MAVDGSFCVEYELERFLGRCPRLASVPQLDYLAKKGRNLTEDELINGVAELFLHPRYTISIVGCFRPITQRIIDRVVALLRLVPDLTSNSNDSVVELDEERLFKEAKNSDDDEIVSIINLYVECGRGLSLHELSCLAFSRALDLVPYVLGSVRSYFSFAPPPFKRIMEKEFMDWSLTQAGTHVLNAVRVSYRLLLAEPEVFTKLWDWSCYLDLVQKSKIVNGGDAAILMDIRWSTIQVLSLILKMNDKFMRKKNKMSDTATVDFGFDAEEAFLCLLRWQEFFQDVSLEKAGWYLEPPGETKLDSSAKEIKYIHDQQLQSLGHTSSVVSWVKRPEIGQSSLSNMEAIWDRTNSGRAFVLTPTVKKSFEMVLLAVSQRWPVLLYGPPGAGKTALISRFAQIHGSRVLTIHMDEQIDGKTLIGSYVCAEQPGEFRWQPGSLTQAILNGLWVVFEDIDKAPADVQSILLPLLEGGTSFLTGHGEPIRVSEGFRLFSTVSNSRDASGATKGRNSLGALWRRVMLGPSNSGDLKSIVKAWYPELEPLSERLIETFERVSQISGFQLGAAVTVRVAGRFSLRDLLKWCKRIAGLGFHFGGDTLSAYVSKSIYQEAVDVFASSSGSADIRLAIMKEIAEIWAVPISAVIRLYPVDKPVIQDLRSETRIGRVTLQCTQTTFSAGKKPFVDIRNSLHVLERIAGSVKYNEPVLLVGETGTGKTTLVQNLAGRLGQKLTVLNLSQQSDVADLLGGFKPMNAQFICLPLYQEFENLFARSFSSERNEDFLASLKMFVSHKNWNMLFSGFQKGVLAVDKRVNSGPGSKRKRALSEELRRSWEIFSIKLKAARAQISASDGMVFSFVEGAVVTALKKGEWILLDEVNLAPPETLQRVVGVLEGEGGSLCLSERGDVDYIYRHPDFRIFACMNPATDSGKRDLPFSLRSRFTEYFVDDVTEDEDLILFVNQFMDGHHSDRELTSKVVQFYKVAKKESEERLQDGANQKPQYSLRSLYRALEYAKKARRNFGFQKAIYDGFSMFFLTLLDLPSAKVMNQLILRHLLGGVTPMQVPFYRYLEIGANPRSDDFIEKYVLTKSVKEQLSNLARAIFIGRYPVLLQGPTSSGKTSLVQYLAAITGHEFVRVNNHEHTDLQEYLGSYITGANGKLVFQEGVLVKAVRHGYWIVLDELNLAPSDVLEALNRLLDDNREIFVPELRETIRAHPDFMLFATQNPPTLYGGRKMLSRAFRNRFVEVHVDEIPRDELCTILERRCEVPDSYANKMVEVMKDLQLHRQSSKVFAGKHGFITPRDLFRWANRFRTFGKSYEDLAQDGYYLLAERLRDDAEKKVVQEVLEKQLRVRLCNTDMYKEELATGNANLDSHKSLVASEDLGRIIWTDSMRRLYFLVERCYRLREPVLLVGETGGGKTTVCQLLSIALGSKLHILNCHQYTETSDFLGGFYPVRERSELSADFKILCEQLVQSKAIKYFPRDATISFDINQASAILNQVDIVIKDYRQGQASHPEVTEYELDSVEQIRERLSLLHQKWCTIFVWQDGPLVRSMKNGDLFLLDEISLADDSVLERLNSVLEPERKLSLAEKGGPDLENVTAHPNFFLLATMNPGGDYGKKELSPALRNRFTEIWVPPVADLNELKCIALEKISNPEVSYVVDVMMSFWKWFNQLHTGRMLTVRDLLSWVAFINVSVRNLRSEVALVHGAFLVLLDGLSLGTGISKSEAEDLRERCLSFLMGQLKESMLRLNKPNRLMIENYDWTDFLEFADALTSDSKETSSSFGIHPFYIEKGDEHFEAEGFDFEAPTTRRNALRVLRAMQLKRPVLLEGSPGVGKTSLIVALGKFSAHSVVRINLSEQTDIMDLLGSDLPVESDEGMQFAWSDGILLQALKKGSWVLLDELNLAPQSVLEGLNAILDHRAEVFIPELGHTFKCPSSFRVFACQNPSNQGGGRKGLPKSFLNRFTKVYVDELGEEDYLYICSSLYPSIPTPLLSKLILFNKRLHEETMLHHRFGQDGSPWEFNLRDVVRSCQMIQGAPESSRSYCFLNTVYVQRMRSSTDRQEVIRLYEQVFGLKPFINLYPRIQLNPENLIVGNTYVKRNYLQSSMVSSSELKILPEMRQSLEAVANCVHHQWLVLLIGPSASGKTSLIRLLAQLTGNILNELNLSSATDISELLGSFEQYNAIRNFRLAVERVERYINEYCCLQIETSTEAFTRRKDLISRWLAFSSKTDYHASSSISASAEPFSSLPLLVEIIEILRLNLENDSNDLNRLLKTIKKLQDDPMRSSAKFEWVTGLLIRAIENGQWIVLENANLCNPTVLDRINSLVEQSGSITVNECGAVDGKPVVLHPHPEFRMFLTVNPTYGEVSRAMRNRGVEIYMLQPYWLLGETGEETELKDVKRFLALSNIPSKCLVDAMAKAHISAKREGLQHGVSISNLELMRWVQLFQRLLTNGNQPSWSLQISWEHTYLSSLGEVEGKDVVNEAINSYLSMPELYNFKSLDCSLCLPGGWPAPFKVHDFVWYSNEATVKQNCMYLEYLGAQASSHSFRIASAQCKKEHFSSLGDSMRKYVLDVNMLHVLTFPNSSGVAGLGFRKQTGFELTCINKKLLFAANWTIEQATETDLKMYLLWLSWFGDQLQGYYPFYHSFLNLVKKELDHPIWNCIKRCRGVLLGSSAVDMELKSIPLLSLDLADLTASVSKSCSELLVNAINSVGLLRLSYQQWHAESEFIYSDKTRCFANVLRSLRKLEERILDKLVESSSFSVLFELYRKLLDDHFAAWNSIVSSQFECVLVSWRSLTKDVIKLLEFCPHEVQIFQEDNKNLEMVLSYSFNSQRSLLWVHGGHPFSPSSVEVCRKQQELVNLCESIWPREFNLQELDRSSIDAAVSTNPEMRFLAMQGVCMSAFIMSKAKEEDLDVQQQLEEMCQMLLSKFGHEKDKLEGMTGTNEQTSLLRDLSSCCILNPEILCQTSALSCWLHTLPLNDYTSFHLDMRLLQQLSDIVILDGMELQSGLSRLGGLLVSTLKFSLNFSSRPPTDFSPHQKISWVLDAWNSVNSVHAHISSSVLEMWFKWHTSLWKHQLDLEKNLSQHGCHGLLPDMLFQPVKTVTIDQILRCSIGIKDFSVHELKLGVASRNLWLSSQHVAESRSFLLSAARSLFQQIILAHKNSFEAYTYSSIRSIFCSAQEKMVTQADVNVLISLLASSSHHVFKSLISSLIKPLLDELYLRSSRDSLYDLGCAWLHIGGLRYHLLVCCDDVDPVVKNNFKYFQLTEKIASLELEIEVRQECAHLAGCFSLSEPDRKIINLLEKLKADRKMLERKIVFRPDPGKFKKLRSECDEFMKLVATSFVLVKKVGNLNVQRLADQVQNWQETAARFVERLSKEYNEYVDIIQPVQVAIYEMKLGLSLVLSSSLQKQFSDRFGQDNIDVILRAIYSFVRFPRGIASKDVSYENIWDANLSSFDKDFPTHIGGVDMNMLETWMTCMREDNSGEKVSVLQLKAAIHQNILLRVVHSAAEAHFLDNASFMLLDKMFDEFASLWMNMKVQVRTKEEHDAQQYRFRPRAFIIENVIETDIATLESSIANEAFSEWRELASEGISTEGNKDDAEHEMLEETWNSLLESILTDMVHIHNALFGSMDLLRVAGSIQVSDSDRLRSFMDSYALGARLIKDLEGLLSSNLETKLTPEHVLRLCLEHDLKFSSSYPTADAYNFYKDSNASLMSKMIDPVTNLQGRIRHLQSEWDDHPALHKILDAIEMILSIPLTTPLAKALSGLQFLLNRVRSLQETVSKFPFSDQLKPIIALVTSWQKLEFDSWPTLLDEVQGRFDINAGQLWFPLYSVLRHRHSAGTDDYSQSTIQSLEEFIQTSSIGEFKRRLQLLFAFHGQFSTAMNRGCKSSYCHEDNLKILYNTFGFYVQFLPITTERLASNRRSIEVQLNDLLKLSWWKHKERYLTMEASKQTRQRFKKLIQKYTDMLQEPVMFIITQEAARSGIRTAAVQALGPAQFSDSLNRNRHILSLACDQFQFREKERYPWFVTWRDKVDLAMENMRLSKTIKSDYSFIPVEEAEVNASIISKCIASQLHGITQEEREQVWYTLKKISTAVTNCCELWKVEKKNLGKRRALSEFLKLLDSCGLSKHRSTFLEDQLKTNNSSRWFLQPTYVMQHLLPTEGRLSSGDNDVAAFEKVHNLLLDNVEIKWQTANEYFFKSIAALGHLRQVCLNFHKDFTLEQVNRSVSYLDHLIEIQKEQRRAAYDFSESMERLKKCSLPLQSLFSGPLCSPSVTTTTCFFSHNQHIALKCMWQQKKLFDDMCRTLHDECLLLKTVENNHLSNCETVGAAAGGIRLFLEKFIPDLNNSKELLDKYLLGHNDVLVNASVLLHPCGITTQMEQLVQQNFKLVWQFREQLGAFHEQDAYAGSVKTVLINHFEDILAKGDLIAEDYESALEARRQSTEPEDVDHLRHISEVNAGFVESLRKTCKHIVDAFDRVGSVNNGHDPSGEALSNISNWGNLFISRIDNLQLGTVHDALVRTINFAGELVDHYGNGEPSVCLVIEAHLKHLYSLLEPLITYGDGLLNDFLVVHRTVAIITHVLAKIFASLYSQGFGNPAEDQEDENDPGKTQDASGTGMGEGAGVKDVSEQIEDEDQLLGTSEKFGEEQDTLNDVPSKNDRGIEMEQDFTADAFSVSEDSGDDDDDDDKNDEDKELEMAMGETGADSEIIDEKHWDNKDDNDENRNKNEKYESGPSVKDNNPSGRELRAKEDNATTAEEPGEVNPDDSNRLSDEKDGEQGPDDTENVEDMEVDKEDAFSEPTGLKLDEPNVGPEKEDINMNEQGVDNSENDGAEASDELPESNNGELESTNPLDCSPDQTEPETSDNIEMDDAAEINQEKDSEKETAGPTNDVTAPVTSDFGTEHQSNAESATQPIGGSHAPSLRNVAPEAQWSNTSDLQSELAPVKGLPNSSENEITITDSSKGGKLGDDQWNQVAELDSSFSQKNVPNPFRNVGDALDGWKERAKVNVDLDEKNDEAMDVLLDENAAEYGFTSGLDKGTAQALGPAASDQIDRNIERKKPTDGDDNGIADRNDCSEMDMEEQPLESQPIKSHSINTGNKVSKQKEVPEVEMQHETPEAYNPGEGDQENQSESLVRMKRSYMHDDINQFGKLSVSDDDLGKAHNLEDVSPEMRDNASALWRRYELRTTRLSQELAEQLRLVMEPTLASKLQGDYKTGKRINMKKVIPYIASHYRKDKIWLRRTRPNKRNYQVVIAVDDSRSMSESHCGDVAIEALVTVCRAMSQLEVGNLAVASFGRKGNIRLLHDFDQPFNGEAGVKMLSSLTFKQENTIADDPVVDLLKYLNNMLDAAVINARLPSGHNPLEQLVLIIADGRFHEKENLKRCVRDIMSKKCMVAFLLLDSPQESIMDLTEASFQGGNVKIVKYLDSFPFPFYVVLKDIEALPRTLADLLRQWFELMQQSGD